VQLVLKSEFLNHLLSFLVAHSIVVVHGLLNETSSALFDSGPIYFTILYIHCILSAVQRRGLLSVIPKGVKLR